MMTCDLVRSTRRTEMCHRASWLPASVYGQMELNSLSTTLINIVPPGTICKKILKKLRYFRLLPNLAQRIFIDLANHLPSFTPNKALVTEKEFFQF